MNGSGQSAERHLSETCNSNHIKGRILLLLLLPLPQQQQHPPGDPGMALASQRKDTIWRHVI